MSAPEAEDWVIVASDDATRSLTRYRVDTERGLIVSESRGVFTRDEFSALRHAVRMDSRFRQDLDMLADIRAIGELALTVDDLADQAREPMFDESSTGRHAYVTGEDLGRQMLLRLYAALNEHGSNRRYAVFESLEEAIAWLDEPREK